MRGPARERILADRGAESTYVSGRLQAAALDVVTEPGWQTHLRNLGPQNVPAGGLNPWARLPRATNIDRLTSDCEAAGVMIAAGSNWFPAQPTGSFVRLNYSGPNPGAFADGAPIIGQSLAANH
ncbi:DNA-binding transcriptional MocR family regulator [Marisediminicola sp. UYEF4]